MNNDEYEWLRLVVGTRTRGMTTERWMQIEPSLVLIDTLVPIQPPTRFGPLSDGRSWSGDELPHVVALDDILYIEDGHTRYYRAMKDGQDRLTVRILRT